MERRKISQTLAFSIVFALIAVAFPRPLHAAATITVISNDGAGEGFNDPAAPDAASTTGGNTGATLGAQRLIAFQFAANIWGGVLDSSVEIRVAAQMDPLTCGPTSATLGSAGPNGASRDFAGAPRAGTFYPAALANRLANTDLVAGTDDIGATFNSSVGTTCTFPRVWYYGLNGAPPAGTIDFVTVVLHELAHGLGFVSFVNLTTGAKPLGFDDAYSLFLEDHSTGKLYPAMTDAERLAASIDTGDLHWVGVNVVAESVFLTAGRVQPSGHVRMYAPNPAVPGSSVSHFDTALAPDQLMEPIHTGPDHTVLLELALLEDIGWATGKKTDVFFVTDLSGSFFDDLPVFKAEAPTIITDLKSQGHDLKVGLGSFEDYPISPFGDAPSGDVAYRRNIDLTSDTAAVQSVIAGLFTRFGGDGPESQLPALFQAASGQGQDLSGVGFPGASIPAGQQANFRNGAVKLFLLWTDAPFHRAGDAGTIPYPGPSFNDTVNAILALDPPKVIGIASGNNPGAIADLKAIAQATGALAPAGGVDCDGNGTIDVPEGQPLVCSTAITGTGVGAAMEAVIEAATRPTEISIDVRTSLNDRSGGLAVSVLTTATFNALSVDPKTLCMGNVRTYGVGDCTENHGRSHIEDVNLDGFRDVVLHFSPREAGIRSGDSEVCLTGKTLDGISIQGCHPIIVVGK